MLRVQSAVRRKRPLPLSDLLNKYDIKLKTEEVKSESNPSHFQAKQITANVSFNIRRCVQDCSFLTNPLQLTSKIKPEKYNL